MGVFRETVGEGGERERGDEQVQARNPYRCQLVGACGQ